jgi:hypothetical protein
MEKRVYIGTGHIICLSGHTMDNTGVLAQKKDSRETAGNADVNITYLVALYGQ